MATKQIPRTKKGGAICMEEQNNEMNHARKLLEKVKNNPIEKAKVPVIINSRTTIFINPKKK